MNVTVSMKAVRKVSLRVVLMDVQKVVQKEEKAAVLTGVDLEQLTDNILPEG